MSNMAIFRPSKNLIGLKMASDYMSDGTWGTGSAPNDFICIESTK